MEVVLAITTMITATNIPSCNILFPAPLRFGIEGNPPPPRSNLVVVGIFSPSAAHPRRNRAAQLSLPPDTWELHPRFRFPACAPARLARFVVLKSAVMI